MNEVNFNEDKYAAMIAQRLNYSLRDISTETITRLSEVRRQALACQKSFVLQSAPQSVLATVGNYLFPDNSYVWQILFSFLLFVSVVVCSTFWVADRQINEMGAIDSELLADDLPITAFTDQGFNAWLKRSSSE